MRKQITGASTPPASGNEKEWLDLEKIAQVEISSEDAARPIEGALVSGDKRGWMAAQAGKQTVRLLFDEPQKLSCIRVVFREEKQQRTQEFVLRWSKDGVNFREIVRQQYNFNPPADEIEEYELNLEGISVLELEIIPDIGGGSAAASLDQLRLA